MGPDFRAANDRIARRALELRADDVRVPFVCECPDPDCREPVLLTVADYEELLARREPIVTAEHLERVRT